MSEQFNVALTAIRHFRNLNKQAAVFGRDRVTTDAINAQKRIVTDAIKAVKNADEIATLKIEWAKG